MAYSHCMEMGPEQVQGTGLGAMGPNVHPVETGKGTRTIVPYCPGPVQVLFPYSVNEP